MQIIEHLFSNILLRSMLTSFGFRTPYWTRYDFTPFFQYRIGAYQPDYYLYFPRKPFTVLYKNEIFNKMCEYVGYDTAKYLDFHYDAYPDKADFIRFLRYETTERQKLNLPKKDRFNIQATMEWINEKLGLHRTDPHQKMKEQIREDVKDSLNQGVMDGRGNGDVNLEKVIEELTAKIALRMSVLVSETESKMENMSRCYDIGTMDLNNQNHWEKYLRLQVLIRDIKAPKEIAKGEQLFRTASANDIACMLRLHYKGFRNKKNNTIQKEIAAAAEAIRLSRSEVIRQLEKLLSVYFYNSD